MHDTLNLFERTSDMPPAKPAPTPEDRLDARVLRALGPMPLTTSELVGMLWQRMSVEASLVRLQAKGLIERDAARVCAVTRREAGTWRIVR